MSPPEVVKVVVASLTRAAEDVVGIELRDPSGQPLGAWEPGAHVDLVLPSGLVRQYSLCGDPGDLTRYRIAVLRERAGRGGSAEVHDSVREGDVLGVIGPRNKFALVDAPGYLFLAGGIGVTPLLPMTRAASAARRPWRMVYGGRSRATMALVDELARVDGGRLDLVPEDERGRPDLDALVAELPSGHHVYSCGPGPMLDAVKAVCARHGVDDRLHTELFAPEGPAPVLDGTDRPIEVTLQRAGVTVTVPGDRTILSVVRDVVPSVLYSCEEGDCGTCETAVLAGTPDHRDVVLTDDEKEAGDTMMICVSRASTPTLTLDL